MGMSRTEQFSSRWGLMLAMLGMAVGTGNIWRFPREAATHGGGSFLIPWVIFLLAWSIPLILVEFALGKHARCSAVSAFIRIARGFAWMGAWVAWTATAIMFYYAVVTGWTLRFLVAAVAGELPEAEPGALWQSFSFSLQVLPFHALAMGLGILVVARGVRGIETAARILMPSLLALVLVLVVRAVTLPGATDGLRFLFTPSFDGLADYRVWLAALTQNAWDTGAGWGLILTYAIYARAREDTTLNAFLLGIGNNMVSLLAGTMVLCTVFALLPAAADQIVGAGNEGLTFIWVPELFARMPAGRLFMILFFVALFFAAWSSLVAMIELATRVLMDAGVTRGRAVAVVSGVGFLLGVPSALSEATFQNQDFVWGVGLMVSGFFFAVAALRYGVRRFRETLMNTLDANIHIRGWWDWAIRLVVLQAIILVAWWFWQVREEPLFGRFGVGGVVVQWAIALATFVLLNRWIVRRSNLRSATADANGTVTSPDL